jgi:hypothetical protein
MTAWSEGNALADDQTKSRRQGCRSAGRERVIYTILC